MDSFVFALDTTMPVFLVILLGWFLRRVGILNEGFCKPAINTYLNARFRSACFSPSRRWMYTAILTRLSACFASW